MLQHKFVCPDCDEPTGSMLYIVDEINEVVIQCMECFTIYLNVYNDNHKIIDHVILEDEDNGTEFLR